MDPFYLSICLVLAGVLLIARQLVLPPGNFPRNIPTIPFYVSFLGSYTSLDQRQIYEKFLRTKLEKHGAVKIYFASRWNILVTKPEYLKQILKEDTFEKHGNQVKIPNSVLSEYTGDNLISSHGENWKLYREVLTQAIQFPNIEPLEYNANCFVSYVRQQLQQSASATLTVTDSIQRLTLQNIGDCLFGINFKLFDHTNPEINQRLRQVKSQIFKPLYLNFPSLDSLPIPSRIKARRAVKEFKGYFCDMVKKIPSDENNLGSKLSQALQDGSFTEKQFQDNSMIVMIAGHENPQLLLSSLLYVLSKNKQVQNKLRESIQSGIDMDSNYYLHAVIYETLRMFPPLGQIINRWTTQDVILGSSIVIPKGTYVGYNNLATGRDRNVWHLADSFLPERWGSTMAEVTRKYNLAKSKATMPAFHGRKRACLGEKFALNQMKQTLSKLLLQYEIGLDPNWEDKLTQGGPVAPFKLQVVFTDINRI